MMVEIWTKNHLISEYLQHCKSILSREISRMTNNVGLTFGVGDTIPQSTIGGERSNWNW